MAAVEGGFRAALITGPTCTGPGDTVPGTADRLHPGRRDALGHNGDSPGEFSSRPV